MNRILELREKKHMSQQMLSIELDVEQGTISSYESGRHNPSVKNLLKMSKLFNVSCDYILGVSDVKNVLSGGEYSVDEVTLVSQYRELSPSERLLVKAYTQGLLDKKNNK